MNRSVSVLRKIATSGPVVAVKRKLYFGNIYMHERMLGDTVRLDAYHRALERYVGPGDVVLDVGTGTGVLAFMAAARKPAKVYALDHSKPMIQYAQNAAKANGVEDVTFVNSPATKFNPPEKVDVIVQEQMASVLFAERMLDTILDLRDRVLKPGGRILPAIFELYLEPVQLKAADRVPFVQEQRVHGLTFPRMSSKPPRTYYWRSLDPGVVDYLLCEPSPVLTLDLRTVTRDQLPAQFHVRKPVVRPGQMDGICSFFRARFDDSLSFTTAPGDAKTHWSMPLYRTPVREYGAGEIFHMTVDVPELSDHLAWRWSFGATPALGSQ